MGWGALKPRVGVSRSVVGCDGLKPRHVVFWREAEKCDELI